MDVSANPKVMRQKHRALRKTAGGRGGSHSVRKVGNKMVANRKGKDAMIEQLTSSSNGEDTSETIVKDTPPEERLLRKRKSIVLSTNTGICNQLSIKKRKENTQEQRLNKVTAGSTSCAKGVLDEFLDAETGESSGDESKPKNLFGLVDIQEGLTYYRCNLKTAFRDLHNLPFKQEHMSAIKKTPFWVLFNSIMTSDSKKMRQRCNKFEEDIRTGITKVDIQLILGVTGGSINIPLKDKNYVLPDWVRRCFGTAIVKKGKSRKKEMYKCLIMRKLREIVVVDTTEAYKDTTRLVHCYLLAMFLAPNRNGSINWHVSCFCENLEKLYTYDWCGFILDQLMTQLQRTQNLMSGGCVMLLLYWLCEHTRLVKPCEDMAIPRYLRWDLKELNVKLRKENLSTMRKKRLRTEIQPPTKMEKETYRKLKVIWDNELGIAKALDKERNDSEMSRDVGHLNDLSRGGASHWNKDRLQTISIASTDESTPVSEHARGHRRFPVKARNSSVRIQHESTRVTTVSDAIQQEVRDAVKNSSGSKNSEFETTASLNQSTDSQFRTPDSGRVTRSRSLQYRMSPCQDTALVCRTPTHLKDECSRANLNITSKLLQKELGLGATDDTIETCGLGNKKRCYRSDEADKNKNAEYTSKVDSMNAVKGIDLLASLVVPEVPSFNLGLPETQNVQGKIAEVEIHSLVRDINSSLGLEQDCEPDFISRNATAAVTANLSDTQVGQMEGCTLDAFMGQENERISSDELKKLRANLADRDKEIECLKEQLQIQTNRMKALEKKSEVLGGKLRDLENEKERLQQFDALN